MMITYHPERTLSDEPQEVEIGRIGLASAARFVGRREPKVDPSGRYNLVEFFQVAALTWRLASCCRLNCARQGIELICFSVYGNIVKLALLLGEQLEPGFKAAHLD